jgi:hypothetical protein
VTGQNLLPFLRVFVGSSSAVFLIQTPEMGEVKLPDNLEPGTYDLDFYNEGQLVAKQPGAVTIVTPEAPPAPPQKESAPPLTVLMRVHSTLVGLSKANLAKIKAGYKFDTGRDDKYVEVHAVRDSGQDFTMLRPNDQDPIRLPLADTYRANVVLRIRCAVVNNKCLVGDVDIHPGVFTTLPVDGDEITLVTGDIEPDQDARPRTFPVVEARVRFVVSTDVFPLVRPGQVCQTWGAELTAVDHVRDEVTQATLNQASARGNVQGTVTVTEQMKSFEATVRMPVRIVGNAWVPAADPPTPQPDGLPTIKAGAIFTFDTMDYVMRGWILSVKEMP